MKRRKSGKRPIANAQFVVVLSSVMKDYANIVQVVIDTNN